MKRVVLVHGWGGSPEADFFPWLKTQLEKNGFNVIAPAMPDTDTPRIETWIPYLAKIVGKSDKNTYFVGHSIGCQTILRYLETVKTPVGGTVFVAGWFNLKGLGKEEKPIAKPWTDTPMNDAHIKKITKIIAFFSTNDPYVPIADAKKFETRLNAKAHIEKNKGHYNPSDGVTEVPQVVAALLSLAKPL